MKPKEVLKKLKEAGFIFSEGTNHTNVLDKNRKLVTQVPRHTKDLKPGTLGQISKQTGVKMR